MGFRLIWAPIGVYIQPMPSRTSVIIVIRNISCILCKPFLPNLYVEPMRMALSFNVRSSETQAKF